jgi:hippurate hydrolase
MSVTSSASAILDGQDSVRGWQEDLYRDIHQHPELSHSENQTAHKVADRLDRAGFDVHQGIGGTGVVGMLGNGDGPTVLLRADMDALPVKEATGLDYASTVTATDGSGNNVPVAHACGHDMHITCLLGAATLLVQGTDQWNGTVIALFQPAEEASDGAQAMVDDGLADVIPTPDVALGQHVLVAPAGQLGTRSGPVFATADSMRITVYGRGGHGAMPQTTVDPVVLAASIVLRLQTVVSREVAPGETAVLTVGSIQAGSASNVIPDNAVLQLNLRCYSDQTRDSMVDSIRRIVKAECQASESPQDPDFEMFNHYPLTDNDSSVTDRVAGAFADMFGDQAQQLSQQTASEDFSDIPTALNAPYTYWGLGGIDRDTYQRAAAAGRVSSDIPANHSPKFAPVIQPTLDAGTQALVTAALAWLAR